MHLLTWEVVMRFDSAYCYVLNELFHQMFSLLNQVLKFTDEDGYEEFSTSLREFLESNEIQETINNLWSEHALMHAANTKEKRDKELKQFFKTALSQVYVQCSYYLCQ